MSDDAPPPDREETEEDQPVSAGDESGSAGDETPTEADGPGSEAPTDEPDAATGDRAGEGDREEVGGAELTTADETDDGEDAAGDTGDDGISTAPEPGQGVPEDVRTYDRFTKMDGAQYERVNDFLRNRTYITAREWAIARLCADFRTETGVEMTKIGQNLPTLVPFMTDTYSPQAVNQARASFEEKVRKAGATFLYGAMSDFFTADELDEVMYEVTEIAKFLLEVEGVDLTVEEELEAEERISSVMRDVRHSSEELRHDGVTCPNCGHEFGVHEAPAPDEPGDDEEAETVDDTPTAPGVTEDGGDAGEDGA